MQKYLRNTKISCIEYKKISNNIKSLNEMTKGDKAEVFYTETSNGGGSLG